MDKEQAGDFLTLINKERSLTEISELLGISKLEVLGLAKEIKEDGPNITIKRQNGDIYFFNQGDNVIEDDEPYYFDTGDDDEFRFILISDTRLGSKYEQLSILNDIYRKGKEFGFDNAIICGNISAGVHSVNDIRGESNFIDDTEAQIDYIARNFPNIGIKTYLVTGKTDGTHLLMNKVNIGKRIAEKRPDIIYLGDGVRDAKIKRIKMQIMATKLAKTYTASYRTQQQIDSYRSENKPDILLYGGLLQMEKYKYRGVDCITAPSVCATTKEMNERRYANTVGAWYVVVKANKYGKLESIQAFNSPYYVTRKDDYLTAKPLVAKEEKPKQKVKAAKEVGDENGR